jgi:hypothetical protein
MDVLVGVPFLEKVLKPFLNNILPTTLFLGIFLNCISNPNGLKISVYTTNMSLRICFK